MVPAGQYFLVIAVNENRVFHELSYDNNRISVPITIGSAPPKSKPMNDHCVDAIQVQAGFHYKSTTLVFFGFCAAADLVLVHTRGSTTDKLKCNGVSIFGFFLFFVAERIVLNSFYKSGDGTGSQRLVSV